MATSHRGSVIERVRTETNQQVDTGHLLYPIATEIETYDGIGWVESPPVVVERLPSGRLRVRYFTRFTRFLSPVEQGMAEDAFYRLWMNLQVNGIEVKLPDGYIPKIPEIKQPTEITRELRINEGIPHIDGTYRVDVLDATPFDEYGMPQDVVIARKARRIDNGNYSPTLWVEPIENSEFVDVLAIRVGYDGPHLFRYRTHPDMALLIRDICLVRKGIKTATFIKDGSKINLT